MNPIRTVLIGYGFAGQIFHAPVIASVSELQLIGVASSNPAKVKADLPKVWVDEIEKTLSHPDVDLVVIATPNTTHFDLAKKALEAGKHVVVDKPFTLTLAQARELVDLAQQQKRIVTVYQNRRWDADFLTLRKLMDAGTLGEIVHFESHFDRYRPEVRDRWRDQAQVGGGLWYDLGPHLADQALQLFGAPQALFADLALQRDNAQAVDYFHVLLRYPRLRVILHGSALVAGGNPRFIVHGTKGSFIKYGLDPQEDALKQGERFGKNWGQDPQSGTLYLPDQPAQEIPSERGDYRKYYQALAQSIQTASTAPITPDQALMLMKTIELGLQSHREKREIAWN